MWRSCYLNHPFLFLVAVPTVIYDSSPSSLFSSHSCYRAWPCGHPAHIPGSEFQDLSTSSDLFFSSPKGLFSCHTWACGHADLQCPRSLHVKYPLLPDFSLLFHTPLKPPSALLSHLHSIVLTRLQINPPCSQLPFNSALAAKQLNTLLKPLSLPFLNGSGIEKPPHPSPVKMLPFRIYTFPSPVQWSSCPFTSLRVHLPSFHRLSFSGV